MSSEKSSIEVTALPKGHIVVGYIAHLKVLDEEGEEYFATRIDGLGDMEMLGMAVNMADWFRQIKLEGKQPVSDDD